MDGPSSEGPAAVRRALAACPDPGPYRVRRRPERGNPIGMTEPEDLDLPPITEAMTAPAAARAAEEALRQAAHASWDGVTTAADVYTVFGAVGYSLELIPQLLDQLTAWLEKHQDRLDVSEAGHVRGCPDRRGPHGRDRRRRDHRRRPGRRRHRPGRAGPDLRPGRVPPVAWFCRRPWLPCRPAGLTRLRWLRRHHEHDPAYRRRGCGRATSLRSRWPLGSVFDAASEPGRPVWGVRLFQRTGFLVGQVQIERRDCLG